MSHAIAFDTLAYANKLKAAGVPERQAEVQAEAIAGLINEQMATKRDLAELEAVLRRDIKELDVKIVQTEANLRRDIKELDAKIVQTEANLRRDMKEIEMRLTIRLGAMMVIAVGVVATLVKLL